MQVAHATSPVLITDRESNLQIGKDFTSNLIGSLSGGMFSFGMGLMLLNQTHLAISFGLSTIVGPLVSLLLFVPMGSIVDRYPHRSILIVSNLVRLLGLGLFAWALPGFPACKNLFRLSFLPLLITYAAILAQQPMLLLSMNWLMSGKFKS